MSKELLITSNLFEEILLAPIRRGAKELFILTGDASARMVSRHFDIAKTELGADISIDLHMGMTGVLGILRSNLKSLQEIPRQLKGRSFNCSFSTTETAINSKIYVWCNDSGPVEAFLGSGDYILESFDLGENSAPRFEAFTRIDPVAAFDYVLALSRGGLSYKSGNIHEYLQIHDDQPPAAAPFSAALHRHPNLPYIDLPLISNSKPNPGEVSQKSGLNWGQRPGRNLDQAYIPIPSNIGKSDFFPDKGTHFQVVTDDGQAFICTVAQQGNKALETPHDNALLGRYFRKRLGLPAGAIITKNHLIAYGSFAVRIYRQEDGTYLLSFAPNQST
jgi:hypothetical protein